MEHGAEPDIELLRVVRRLRSEDGACTVRSAATEMGMSVAGMQHRIDRAIAAGHVERSDVAGSIRIAVAAGNLHLLTTEGNTVVEVIVTDDGEILDARIS